MIYMLCDFGPGYQVYKGIDDTETGGVLGVIVNGKHYTGDTLNAANAYTGTVRAVPGNYQFTLDGDAVSGASGTAKGWPTDGVITIGLIADSQPLDANQSGFAELLANEPDMTMWIGEELHYLDDGEGGSLWGDAGDTSSWANKGTATSGNESIYANYLMGDETYKGFAPKTWHQSKFHVDRQAWYANQPVLGLVDNHEFGGSLGMGLSSGVDDGPGFIGYDSARYAAYQFSYLGWPSATGDVDSEPTPLMYGSKEFGNLLVIWCDQHSYDFNGGRNLHSGTVGEIKQPVWIGDQIANTSCEFVLIIFVSPPQTGMGSWTNPTNTITDYINDSSKTIFGWVGDMHVLWERMLHEDLDTNPMYEIGCSPCGPTDGTAVIAPFSGDEYYTNYLNAGTTLTAEYDPNAVAPADKTLTVADTSMMSDTQNDNKQRVWFEGALGQAGLIDSIDSSTQVTLTGSVGSTPIASGTEVWFHHVHGVAHANAGGEGIHCFYTKITIDGDKPIRIQVKETYTGKVLIDKKLYNNSRYPKDTLKVMMSE